MTKIISTIQTATHGIDKAVSNVKRSISEQHQSQIQVNKSLTSDSPAEVPSPTKSSAQTLTEQNQHLYDVQANAQVLKTAEEILGTVISIRA